MDKKQFVCDYIENNRDIFIKSADEVWGYAEPGMKEYKSAACLANACKDGGFKVPKTIGE